MSRHRSRSQISSLIAVLLTLLFCATLHGQKIDSADISSIKYTVQPATLGIEQLLSKGVFNNTKGFPGVATSPDSILWFEINLVNGKDKFLYLDAFRSHNFIHQLKLYDDHGHLISQGGAWLSESKLSHSKNRFALELPNPGTKSEVVYLAIKPLTSTHLMPFSIALLTKSEAAQQRGQLRLEDYQNRIAINGAFYGIVLVFLFLAAYQYAFYREKVYLFYFLYLISVSLVYVRNIESYLGKYLTIWGNWGKSIYGLETTFVYLSFGSYVLFLYYFLNLKIRHKKWVDQLFLGTGYLLLAMIVVDVCIQILWGIPASRSVFHSVRLFFMPIGFVGIFILLIHFRSYLFWYILIGTSLLLIPACFTAFEQMSEGLLGYHSNHGMVRKFTLYKSGRSLWMYSTRIGIVLEIICFGLGLLYRNRKAFMELQRRYSPTIPSKQEKFLMQLLSIFKENISNENYDISQMSQDLSVSKSMLFQKVKACTGKTPILYLRHLRLEEGRKLLQTTDQNISEIAYSIGFKDPNYFTRVFTKEYGVSPKRMREGKNK